MSTTLVILAHPDDEIAVGPGTIAHLVSLGERVVLYYATLGEGGISGLLKAGGEWISPDKLAEVRSHELSRAANLLGVSKVIVRNFGDGKLDSQKELLQKDILEVLEQERPNKVVTFPPSGLTYHMDHMAVSQCTTEAIHQYSGKTQLFQRVIKDHCGVVNVVHDDLTARYRVSVEKYRGTIYDVMHTHKTQVRSMDHIFPALREGRGVEDLWRYEYFAAVPLE
ncbi:PIG-L family deacetylase [Shimazuella sp. AN120528]|nr:PIG-L family deacetylase [Shimazuella soli]